MACIGGVTSLYDVCGVRPGTGFSLGGRGGIGDGGLGPEVLILAPLCDALWLPLTGCSTVVVPPGPVVVVVVVVVCQRLSISQCYRAHGLKITYRGRSGDDVACPSISISFSGYVLMARSILQGVSRRRCEAIVLLWRGRGYWLLL